MPGNPVRRKPIPETDLSAIPGTLSPEQNRQRIAYDKEVMKAYKASMPQGDILDTIRAPINLFSNSMAGLGAEMIGKGKQFEDKYAYTPKTKAELDAVEAMLAVLGPGIDLMDYLKIPPIVGPNTPTIAAALQGVDRAAARLTAEQAKKAAANAGQAAKTAVKDVATSDAAYNLANKVASATGAAPKQIMMGPMSKTWRKTDADLAVKMEGEGRSANDIWRKTGTFRAPDGKLRQEIPDIDMRYTSGEVEKKQYTSAKKRHEQAKARATTPEELNDANEHWNKIKTDAIFNLSGKAQDFVNHPELFAAYPELAKYAFKQLEPTHSQFTAPETVYGFYSPTNRRVTINTDAPYKRSTALHELQHAIQEIEGWQGGSNPEYITAKMAERDIAKKEAKEIQDRINNMKATDPVLYEDLIRNEEGALGQRQYLLNQTSPLEGVTDPYEAYKKMSGEEEARMVQARRDYDERQRQDSLPIWNYETSPSEQITKDFATGGEVHMAGGGFLEMMAKAAKEGVTRAQRLAMSNKDVAKRIPALEEAIAALERGEITKQQYAQLVQAYKPVAPYETFFKPESDEKIIGALTQTNREKEGTRPKQSYFGVPSSTLKRGDKAATRQDIPAYTHADTWVVTAHEPQQGRSVYAGAGPRIGYEPMAMLNDVKFQVHPSAAMKIAKGGQKGTIATMEGYWEPITRELAEEMGPELMRDPRWVQAGMDPTRSASFYDRKTMQPILEGEQVLHSGPLVLVKNPLYGDIEDFPFKKGGEVRAAKGGLLGALAKTAERGLEMATKGAKAAPQDEALRLAQLRAALPPAQGGLGLPANNTPMQRAKAMRRDTGAYHGSKQDITGAFKPGYDDNLAFVTKSPDFANKWIGKGKHTQRTGDQAKQEVKAADELRREIRSKHIYYDDALERLQGQEFNNEYDRRSALANAELDREFPSGMTDKIHSTVYPLTVESNKIFNPETDMDVMLEFFEKNSVPQDVRNLYAGGNYMMYETKPVVEYLKGKGYDSMRLRESTGDDYPTIAVFNPESVRSRFAAHDPWRKDAATAAAFGVAAPDLLAQEQEPEKELTIDEFLKRMKER